jgi:cytochrome b involved in lipid metabolism
MSNIEVDELLFVYKLHEDTKKFHQADLKKQIKKLTQDPTINESDKNSRPGRIDLTKRYQEIAAVFIFHNISAFYLLKRNFDSHALARVRTCQFFAYI